MLEMLVNAIHKQSMEGYKGLAGEGRGAKEGKASLIQ